MEIGLSEASAPTGDAVWDQRMVRAAVPRWSRLDRKKGVHTPSSWQ